MAEYLFRRRHRPEWLAGKVPPDTELAASGFQPSQVPARRWLPYAAAILLSTLAVDEPIPAGTVLTPHRAPAPPRAAALRTWLASYPPPDAVVVEDLPEGSVRTYGRLDARPRVVPNVRIGGGAGVDREAPVGRGLAHVPIFPRRTAASAFAIFPTGTPFEIEALPAGRFQFLDRPLARPKPILFGFNRVAVPEAEALPEGRIRLHDRIEPRHATAQRTWLATYPPAEIVSLEALPPGTVRFYGRTDVRPRVVPNVRIGGGASTGTPSVTPPSRGRMAIPTFPRRFRAPYVFPRVAVPPDEVVPSSGDTHYYLLLALTSSAAAVQELPPGLGAQTGRAVGVQRAYGAPLLIGSVPFQEIEDPASQGFQTAHARGRVDSVRRFYTLPMLIGRVPFEPPEAPPLPGFQTVRAPGKDRQYGLPVLLAHVAFPEAEVPAGSGYIELSWAGRMGLQRAAASAYWALFPFVPPPDFIPDLVPPTFPVGGEIRGSRWDDITGQVWEDIRGSRWLDSA